MKNLLTVYLILLITASAALAEGPREDPHLFEDGESCQFDFEGRWTYHAATRGCVTPEFFHEYDPDDEFDDNDWLSGGDGYPDGKAPRNRK